MLKFYKNFVKKKKFYYGLVLYFVFLTHKILLFFNIDKLKNLSIINLGVKYLKINSSYILPIFKFSTYNYIQMFKNDLLLVYFNDFHLINKILNIKSTCSLLMISINSYFLNIKFIKNINLYNKLFDRNFITLSIFTSKLFYIFIAYKKKLEQILL
jgi:hypothetical protein